MRHKLINSTSIETLLNEIEITLAQSFTPTLAFIYISVNYDIKSLLKKLSKYDFLVVGVTTVGEIYANSTLGVNCKDKTITCMLTNLEKSAFKLKVQKKEEQLEYEIGKKIAKWTCKNFDNSALLTFTAGLDFNNESYINGLQKKISYFFGAVAGDDRLLSGSFVFSNKKLIANGVLALAIDRDKIEMVMSRGFGWSGIGTQRIITQSDENRVYRIDDKRALEFYQDYLNISSKDMPDMGGDYPMEVLLPNGQVVYRAAIHIYDDGSLLFAGHVPEGAKVRISAPMGELIIDEVKKSLEKSMLEIKEYSADLVLVFPCASHKSILGSLGKNEIQMVYEQTGHKPLIGFYAYGEIASSNQDNAFHNQTFVTMQLREKL